MSTIQSCLPIYFISAYRLSQLSGLNTLNAPPAVAAFPAASDSFLLLMSLLTCRSSLLRNPTARCAAASLFGLQNRWPFLVVCRARDCFFETDLDADATAFFFLSPIFFSGFCIAATLPFSRRVLAFVSYSSGSPEDSTHAPDEPHRRRTRVFFRRRTIDGGGGGGGGGGGCADAVASARSRGTGSQPSNQFNREPPFHQILRSGRRTQPCHDFSLSHPGCWLLGRAARCSALYGRLAGFKFDFCISWGLAFGGTCIFRGPLGVASGAAAGTLPLRRH